MVGVVVERFELAADLRQILAEAAGLAHSEGSSEFGVGSVEHRRAFDLDQ
jgi:hypothetical protein